MNAVEATFVVPGWIAKGLQSKEYVRVGGVIRDAQTGHIVAMLREVAPSLSQASTILSQFGSVASILNLGVSVIGFSIVINRLGEIEQRLKQTQEVLNRIERKTELSFDADFRAALNLARIAFTMDTKPENRNSKADKAIEKLLKVQEVYLCYANAALEEEIQVADEYLSLLFLAYITEARCHLELEEIETARLRLQEGAEALRSRIENYFEKVSPYIHKEEWDKFYKKYPQKQPQTWSPGTVFVTANGTITGIMPLRGVATAEPLAPVELFPGVAPVGLLAVPVMAAAGVPLVAAAAVGVLGGLVWVNSQKVEKQQFPKAMEKMETMIETSSRFEAYQAEVQAIQQLGMSFHDWLQLAPSIEIQTDRAELMYIIPSKSLEV